MKEPIKYSTIDEALAVMDSVCESPCLPSTLYDWQKEAYAFIKAHIEKINCQHSFQSGPLMTVCTKCKATFPNKQTLY